ncbi:MAG: alpha amylase C-terminal domain-containing protein, partial [Anaerolineae bacterium]|nr:alpha amylase C-terminal domain-containing protein [Anaerolineae bacterium]
YGTLADFDRLLAEAHARGIAILIGWSPFSTHPDHPYFVASRDPNHPRHAEFRDYYLWVDDINTRQPRRMGHWQWDAVRGAYHHTVWLTVDKRWCPEVNLLSPRARQENEKVIRFWLDRGADGFWVDCGVWGGFMNTEDHVRFSREMTTLIHSYPAKWVISEGSKSIEAAIVTDGYDSFFADQGRKVPVHETAFRKPGLGTLVEPFATMETQGIHEALYAFYDDPHGNQVMLPFRLKVPIDFNDPADVARAKLQIALHGTLPLVPLYWFPQHCGLARIAHSEHVHRFPFLMMWDDSPHYGFTDATPYLLQNVEAYPSSATVASQLRDPESILSTFKTVMSLRRASPALQCRDNVADSYGRIPTDDDNNCYAYVRRHVASGQAMVIVANLLGEATTFTLSTARSVRVQEMLEGKKVLTRRAGAGAERVVLGEDGSAPITLPPYGFAIFEAEN